MKVTHKNIEEYILRFMEGETTHAEEQAIYRFFRTEQVPEHLKSYTPMFAWYEGGMKEEATSVDAPESPMVPLWKRVSVRVWSMGIAAMLTVGIGLGVLLTWGEDERNEWACYEGSYVEVNGKRITDIGQIMPHILETLARAERIEKETQQRMEEGRSIEEYVKEKELILADN